MRILLQNFETGLYLDREGQWTRKAENARAFADEVRATEYRVQQRLANTFVVVRLEPAYPGEPLTIVEAQCDVDSGNKLFIRGEGEGLSWNKGQPLSRFDGSRWVWSSHQASEKVIFKLLLNDRVWAKGEDVVIRAGTRVELSPVFA
jgi:hypothetical protein